MRRLGARSTVQGLRPVLARYRLTTRPARWRMRIATFSRPVGRRFSEPFLFPGCPRTMRQIAILCLLLVAAGASSGCRNETAPAPAHKAQHRGYLRWGPHETSFQPCGQSEQWEFELAVPHEHAQWEPPIPGWEFVESILRTQPRCDTTTAPCTRQEVYVEADGDFSKSGRFGADNERVRQLRLKRVFVARRSEPSCTQPQVG